MYNVRNLGRIAVVAGGPSSERGISIRSGRAVYGALKSEGCDVTWLEIGRRGARGALKRVPFDTAFIALHGRFGEDGSIQKILEGMSVPYTGSGVRASRLALDKIASRRIFEINKIPVPEYRVLDKNSLKSFKGFTFPAVVKPDKEGSSIGLSLAAGPAAFRVACKKAFEFSDRIIVERYIQSREITVGILGRRALPIVEIKPKRVFYDYSAKYEDGRTEYEVPAKLPEDLYKEAQKLALAAHDSLGCSDFSRVDMLLDSSGRIYVLEVNSIPGLTERSLLPKAADAAGIRFGELCIRLLRLAKDNKTSKK